MNSLSELMRAYQVAKKIPEQVPTSTAEPVPFTCMTCGEDAEYYSEDRRTECSRCESKRASRGAVIDRKRNRIPRRYRCALSEVKGRVKGDMDLAALGNELRPIPNVVFYGPAGSGKSSLAGAMMYEFAIDRGWDGLFVAAYELSQVRIQRAAGTGEAELVETCMHADWLLIDDVGNEKNTQVSALPDVVFHRHNYMSPTWVTTGLSASELAKTYGDGFARRVYEGARVIRLGAKP